MLPPAVQDGQLQSRKRLTRLFGRVRAAMIISNILPRVTYFQIQWEAVKMPRSFARFLVLVIMGTLSASAQTRPSSTPVAPAASSAQSPAAAGFDLPKLQSEAVLWLQGLIRINTSNPPGNELVAAKYLADILKNEGIASEIFETTPGRGFLVARLSSSAVPDPSRALLLMGHLDVVGVDKKKWTVDPFAAVMKDGYMYGRGTIDDKGMTIANVAVMVALKRSSARLNRDVILLAEGDEEAGGAEGMKVVVEKHWDKIAAGYSINEGGDVVLKNGKVQYVGVQASEKVSFAIDVIATGTSGHGSIPRKDNPVEHLAVAIGKIGAFETPVQLNSITHAYFEGLSKIEDEETGKWMRALEESDRADHAARWISNASPIWNSMLRDTIAPTMLQAGIRRNVVPSEARGVINIRLLPGNMLSPLLAKLGQLVDDPQIRFEEEGGSGQSAPSSSVTSDLYNTIASVAGREFPGATLVPEMSTGATDSALLRMRSVQAYGVDPFPLEEADRLRMHADDERIPLESFRKGVDFLYNIVTAFAVAK
jgi:acetylornithine deacetylase/succinyl-diaminopimelate desuccinylase-like protein